MKKTTVILLFNLFIFSATQAEEFYFKGCKLSNIASGDYIINLEKNIIEATLKTTDGRVQKFSDKIKIIEKDKIITDKILSGKGDNVYFEYILNSRVKKIIKLEYKKQSSGDIDLFKIQKQKVSECLDVKADWNKEKIEKTKLADEERKIIETQEKIKKEQSSLPECAGNNVELWSDCKGIYKDESGYKYEGLFKNGEILKGISSYPGGANYTGDFKSFKPHGYGTFLWANGDKYTGEWKNGKTDGDGTKTWNDGRKYLGKFENDKMQGEGSLFYPDGKKYVGDFVNGKRHGEGIFYYEDGSAYIGKFINGEEQGVGECVAVDGSSKPCADKIETQAKNFSGKKTLDISIVAKKWVRISQYETNTKKGKKIMDKLKADFQLKATELCSSTGKYNVLQKKIEVLDLDETPAYGLETKILLGINGVIECI